MTSVGGLLEELRVALGGDFRLLGGLLVLLVALVFGLFVGRVSRRLLRAAGVDTAVEGTYFERTARSLGTSTVAVFSRLASWFVYGVGVVAALEVAGLFRTEAIWLRATNFVPNLFVAAAVLAAGVVIGDKAEITVGERLKGVKLPEITLLPRLVKYSIIYVAVLIAASQIGVATLALVVLLAAYALGLIVLSVVALQDLLRSGTAGIYLLLREPYGIGDRVRIGEHGGIVQEVTVFVTRVEEDGREYVVPNHQALHSGVVVVRE